MVDKIRLHRRGAKLIDSLVHGAPNDYERNVPVITVRLECRWNDGPAATSSASAEAEYSCGGCEANEEPQQEWEAEDDVKGGPLDPREVKAARQKEIHSLRDMEVCEYSTEAEARARTGRNRTGLKWIDTNKGGAEAQRYRSRLVCTVVRQKGVEPIFSATSPLETLRVLLCVACQEDVVRVEDPFLISVTDVRQAHFYADAVRDVTVRLPDEESKAKQARRVWEIANDNVRIPGCSPTAGDW